MSTLEQKPGYPNASIKLYEDYDAWKEHRFVELAATFITMTIRDGLFGRNEGMLQFYDNRNIHTKMDGNQIIQISLSNANSHSVYNRPYGIKHFATTVDNKGDNILTVNIEPIHNVENLKFARTFFPNGTESLAEMIRVIYASKTELAPKVDGVNVFVPRVAWTGNIKLYMEYMREIGLTVEDETFPFVWEDLKGIHVQSYEQFIKQDPRQFVVGDINQIGTYVQQMEFGLAYDFQWLTKANKYSRDPMENVTIYSHSFNDKGIERITREAGDNSIYVSRSGGYADMTYRNGYEEAIRLCTMSQYDGYATFKTMGDFNIMPGQKFIFSDPKNQFKTEFYVDEVIHEISNNASVTNAYCFTNSKAIKPVEIEKVKNEIKNLPAPSTTSEPVPVTPDNSGIGSSTDKGGADWDLDKLGIAALAVTKGKTKGGGDCALQVRKALQASQLKPYISGGIGHANQYPAQLVRMNFVAIGQNVTSFKKGDVAVFQKTNTPLGQKYGHVCIYTGKVWCSDFIQPSVQPNRSSNLTYTLYRARKGYSKG